MSGHVDTSAILPTTDHPNSLPIVLFSSQLLMSLQDILALFSPQLGKVVELFVRCTFCVIIRMDVGQLLPRRYRSFGGTDISHHPSGCLTCAKLRALQGKPQLAGVGPFYDKISDVFDASIKLRKHPLLSHVGYSYCQQIQLGRKRSCKKHAISSLIIKCSRTY
jgi:hypothetical protein